jgi:SAM-dependent methyltransferase
MSVMDQRDVNQELWTQVDDGLVDEYAEHPLRRVEEVVLDRFASELHGHVLEIGVGGGRLTRHLLAIAGRLTGIDIAPAMVEHCRRRFPAATFLVADLRDLSALPDNAVDAIVAGYNVLDVLGPGARGETLGEWRRITRDGGLLVLSSHNLHHAEHIPAPGRVLARRPGQLLRNLRGRRRRLANRARLAPLEQHGEHWAVLNDEAHDFGLLHYYASRDEVERELGERGFALIDCLDLEGRSVAKGEAAAACPELHYVARAA